MEAINKDILEVSLQEFITKVMSNREQFGDKFMAMAGAKFYECYKQAGKEDIQRAAKGHKMTVEEIGKNTHLITYPKAKEFLTEIYYSKKLFYFLIEKFEFLKEEDTFNKIATKDVRYKFLDTILREAGIKREFREEFIEQLKGLNIRNSNLSLLIEEIKNIKKEKTAA